MSTACIRLRSNIFTITCPKFDLRAQSAPERKFDSYSELWILPVTKVNALYLLNEYKADEMEVDAQAKMIQLKNQGREVVAGTFPSWYEFKNKPFDAKQQEVLDFAWGLEAAALFMDMGTGKTWTTINLTACRYQTEEITGLLVIPETGQKPVWDEEFEIHCPIDYRLHVHESQTKKQTEKFISTPSGVLEVLVIGIESLSNASGVSLKLATAFMQKHGGKAICVVDESTSIANPSTRRTKNCWELGGMANFRYILNGTPINQGIEDLWSQFRFLDWRIIGVKSYYAFKARHCVMGGFEGRKITGYNQVDRLMNSVKPNSFIVKITEMIDMPNQTWEQRIVELSSEQKRMLKDLGDPFDMSTTMEGYELDAETVLERMTRYQQIVGGFFPYDSSDGELMFDDKERRIHEVVPIAGPNPKLEALKTELKRLPEDWKVLIYARFKPEQELITKTLGRPCIHYAAPEGQQVFTSDERKRLKAKFRDDPNSKYMVTGKSGYKGLNLPFCVVTIYFSNSFSYNDREQSERRTWRKGQDNHVVYVDLTANHKIDKQILQALKYKKSVAEFVNEQLQ